MADLSKKLGYFSASILYEVYDNVKMYDTGNALCSYIQPSCGHLYNYMISRISLGGDKS